MKVRVRLQRAQRAIQDSARTVLAIQFHLFTDQIAAVNLELIESSEVHWPEWRKKLN